MRVVGGRHRGRRLEGPPERSFRPTSDRARESVFNILAHWTLTEIDDGPLDDAPVLDAFCGSGAMGLEALSRGAKRAAFLDSSRTALDIARRNAEALGETARSMIMLGDALRPPPCPVPGGCRVAFLDPPYDSPVAGPALTALAAAGWLAPKAIVVVERGGAANAQDGVESDFPPEGFALLDERRYGVARMLFLIAP